MDRSSHVRGRPVSGLEAAHANEYFEPFLNATTLKSILGYYRGMCDFLHLKPNAFPQFYPKLRANLTTWRAKALWKKFDARASHKCYGKGKICSNTRVLVIGAGPCGLRTAIEAQLLGAKVVVIEKRDRLSRNNVLHLWPFVIEDLRMLGAKKFFGKFCAGAIDHISIRQLQCILLKVALLLGVEVHTEVSFEKLSEPSLAEKTGWKASVKPENHPVSQYEFDVIIGADGKRNTLQGFKRKEFRGKLAIAITANFINKKTEAEARVEEISGVAFIFNQKFFKDLLGETRIDLENIVYYKDDTHYFVMTAKKASLLEKGVILQDLADTEKLLAPDNVDRNALENYAREAADFSTNYQMPDLEFAVNHYGQPDVAMFDFTSMYAAEYASKVVEKNGSKLLMILVGDSLLEPFWPTGSGCARGFLSSLDAAWAIRGWSMGNLTPLEVLAERESIYRLLAQTTPDNLNKDWKSYTLDPVTRYPNLNKTVVLPHQTICLFETDNPNSVERMKRSSHEGIRHEAPKKRRRGNVDNEVLLTWLAEQLREHEDIKISEISSIFKDGKVLCAMIHHYRPDLLDYASVQDEDPVLKNQLAVDIFEKDLGVPPIMTGDELTHTEDYLVISSYLTQVYDTFRGEIPHIKHPKLSVKKKSSTKFPEILSISPPVPPFLLENRKIKVTSITNLKETTNIQRLTKSSDEMVTNKRNVFRIKVKKRRSEQLSLEDIQKCFSEAFLNKKPVNNNMDLIDLTYGDKIFDSSNSNNKNNNNVELLFGCDRGDNKNVVVGHFSEAITGERLSDISLDLPHKFLKKPLKPPKTLFKKKKVDMKKSVLSVIPENLEEKCSDRPKNSKSNSNIPSELNEQKELGHTQNEASAKIENEVKITSDKTEHNDIENFQLPKIPTPKNSQTNFQEYLSQKPPHQHQPLVSTNAEKLRYKRRSDMFPRKPEFKKNLNEDYATYYSPKKTEEKGNISKLLNHSEDFYKETYEKINIVKEKLRKYIERSTKNNTNAILPKPSSERRKSVRFTRARVRSKKIFKALSILPPPPTKLRFNDIKIEAKYDKQTKDSFNDSNLINKYDKHVSFTPGSYSTTTTTLFKKKTLQNSYPLHKNKSKASVDRKTLSTAHSSIQEVFPAKHSALKQKISYRTLAKSSVTKIQNKNKSSDASLEIRVIEKKKDNTIKYQTIEFKSSLNLVTISSKTCQRQSFVSSERSNDYGKSTNRLHNYPLSYKYPKKIRPPTHAVNNKSPVSLTLADVEIISHLGGRPSNLTCRATHNKEHFQKFPSKKNMSASEDCLPHEIYSRVSNWISSHDFKALNDDGKKDFEGDTVVTNDISTDITSVTRAMARNKNKGEYDDIKIEERTDVVKCDTSSSGVNMTDLLRNVKDSQLLKNSKFTHYTPFTSTNFRSTSAPPATFSIIVEGEESELPESNKRSEFSFKTIKSSHNVQPSIPTAQPSRPSSRHKRHADAITQKPGSIDRKIRKRRTLEKVGPNGEDRQKVRDEISANRSERQSRRKEQRKRQTEQFLKSMQMLQANAKPDHSQPFEDYSIFLYRQTAKKFEDRVKDIEKQFTYVPEHETKHITRFSEKADEDIASKIKSLEDKWTNPQPVDKKPKDLYRAIGKIETSDWNIKQIEKKIMENKMGKPSSNNKDKEKVPKWSKEEFMAKLTKMEKKHLDRQDSTEAKYTDIDKNIKHLELKLKEGTTRDLGQNKVASITEKLVSKVPKEPPKPIEKPVERPPVNLPLKNASEFCHFCGKKVYLMEKVSAEGRFFHRGCFKCQYCHTQLRLGSYSFDRDGQYGHKFFCLHHYGMPGELPRPAARVNRKSSQRTSKDVKSPVKKPFSVIPGLDLVDRVQTPERVEFSNLSSGHISSDHEEPLSQMDEDEWTDKNFGASCAEELDDSDDDSSSISDTDSDDEDAFDDALEEPVTKEGTMKWAERWKNSFSRKGRRSDSDGYSSSDHSSYYENSSDDDDTDTATEGEEEIRARELRKQEFRVEPPVVQTDTGTDTEIVSDETTSESSSEILNSATEISTDSEFAQDDPTPTREAPPIPADFYVTKTRGSSNLYPKKIQVKSGYIQRPLKDKASTNEPEIKLKLKPLVPPSKKPAPSLLPRTEGYALNRTQSTGGIAAKVSLELKKKYLLGEPTPGNIQKSGSASTLDTKFRSFQSTISDCQKLLKPAGEISASMQVFCNKLNERHSPILSPQSSQILVNNIPKTDLPPPDITITTIKDNKEPSDKQIDEPEVRARSPVHEASITVPNIDWSKNNQNSQSSDSLSMTSSSENEARNSTNFVFDNIPRVEVHGVNEVENKEDIALDSLCVEAESKNTPTEVQHTTEVVKLVPSLSNSEMATPPSKSIASEKKTLNQPKSLPELEKSPLPDVHRALHVKVKEDTEDSPENEKKSLKALSDRSSPEITAALTETELSDWARDENVSDDIEFDLSHGSDPVKPKKFAKLAEIDELSFKEIKDVRNKHIITEAMSSTLNGNLDNIEFMDTGTETSSDDGIVDSQNGYVLFHDEDDLAVDSLDPNINEVLETRNIYLNAGEPFKNTGFCRLEESNRFGSEVIDLKPADLEKMKQKHTTEHDEDSLLIIDPGTTTEENTCSDSTVKNVTELAADNRERDPVKVENLQKQRLEEKLAKVKAEQALIKEQKQQEQKTHEDNVQFEEHCQRLQSKVEFGNAKDSIDIRKSRRKSRSEIPTQKPDLIQEEKENPSSPQHNRGIVLNLSPDILYKKENIKKERDVNQKLIQEMVMNKMKAENKSLERKKRNRTPSGNKPYELTKSMTTDIVTQTNLNNLDKSISPAKSSSGIMITPDLLSNSPDRNSGTPLKSDNIPNTRPLSVFSTFSSDTKKLPETPLTHPENFSLPDIRKNLFGDDFKTPKAPPRLNRGNDVVKTAEKLRENARVRARLLSNEDLGLSPEDKLQKLKQKVTKRGKENEIVDPHVQESIESLVINTERRNSQLYSNDTLTKKKNNSFRRSKSGDNDIQSSKLTTYDYEDLNRTKSVSEIPIKHLQAKEIDIEANGKKHVCKSDPNLLDTDGRDKPKKKKDRERRRSITKLITNIFKKSPSNGEKGRGIFARLSPKTKEISKSCSFLDLRDPDIVKEESIRRKSLSELDLQRREPTPPPIPPLPANYTNKATDDSSDGETDWKRLSSCDTVDQLDQSGVLECSTSSLNSRRSTKARRAARQAQLKRHRMAQEIQRKLEETEVKTRELEQRGVSVEKALRGEAEGAAKSDVKDEAELLQEWFDLMRDRTELRRYEKELIVRAEELELEDRHARLQHELRDRLESNEQRTEENIKQEEKIIDEMMGIVSKRDSLIAVLEEDRLRYSNEDRDLEEQMLAKGLRLTPIRKSPDKC